MTCLSCHAPGGLAAKGAYLTGHIKRFGDYFIDLEAVPQPLNGDLKL